MGGGASTTIDVERDARPITPEYQLVVVGAEDLSRIPLPSGREYLLGRGTGVHVNLNDQGASRVHARLVVREDDAQIEDLSSANGTFVAGKKLIPDCPVPLRPGDAVTIGSTTLMFQRLTSPPQRRRVWSHVYFLGRLEEECFKAPELGTPFALLRLRLPDELVDGQLGILVAPALRPFDLIARYGAREWEVLLPGQDRGAAEAALARIRASLPQGGASVRAAIAVYGADGRDPASLIAASTLALHEGPRSSAVGAPPLLAVGTQMQDVLRFSERAAAAKSAAASILILGETGVGKTVLARWMHDRSPRAEGLFHRIDLGAVPAGLVETELFGHKKGAFTGATADKAGLLEQASGGTLHLDEIGELSADLQLKLLTALQERQLTRVGETQARSIDVRVIASTNRDLRADMATGRFRSDLFYRLAVLTVMLPPLRDRVSEIAPLARSFLSRFAAEEKIAIAPELSAEALAALEGYAWPGNIRELENALRRAVVFCSGPLIQPEDLGLLGEVHDAEEDALEGEGDPDLSGLDEEQLLERKQLIALLNEHRWVVEHAARAGGLGKTAFYGRLRRLRIPLKTGRRAR
jgi:two-component system response regulator AtoC